MKQLNKKEMETTTPETVTIKSRKRVQEYYGVSQIIDANGRLHFGASLTSERFPSLHSSVEKAAKAVDILLIKAGKEPRNILKFVSRRLADEV